MKTNDKIFNLSKLHINYFSLNEDELKYLKKLIGSNQDCVETFISLTNDFFLNNNKYNNKYYITLKNIRDRVDVELDKLSISVSTTDILNKSFFISSQINFFNFKDIEKSLIEDIEEFLLLLDIQRQDIAISRWGYNHDKESLEVIGERNHLTRERIRQLESGINERFPKYLRIHPKVLWQHIREKMSEDISKLFRNLSTYFPTKNEFYEFIELCCLVNHGDLSKIAHPKVNRKLLETYFCNNPSPIPMDTIIKELVSEFGYSPALAQNILRELSKSDHIKIDESGIYPKNLGKREAVAHALVDHKNGLPWKDITKIINKAGYCRTVLNETRIIQSYFSGSDYIYLSDKGTYRHLKYLDLSLIDIQKHMKYLYDFFHRKNDHRFHLNEYYSEMKNVIPPIEYYVLRHIVRAFGHEYGIYFYGKSSVDSLSLDPEASHVTQYEVIINLLKNSKHPLTKQEIALNLKSKSINHASFYLDKMMENGDVVRIDYATYTTPEQAFSKINELPQILNSIKSIIESSDKIIEIDFFREQINRDLNLSYSKYFFSALISTKVNEFKWFKSNNLVSKVTINYRNLADLFRNICDEAISDDDNKVKILSIINLTKDILDRNYYIWKTNK